MKELSIEEKAKAYNGLIKRLKDLKFAYRFSPLSDTIDEIFPELREEPDDERIRKELLQIAKESEDSFYMVMTPNKREKLIAWLEKQSEQKHADKVESNFEIGEWLCENEPNNYSRFIQILEIVNVQGEDRYRITRDIYKDEDVVEFSFVERYYHKFDIKDAKDGDVLAFDNDTIVIFKDLYNFTSFHSYCYFEYDMFDCSKDELPDVWEGKGFKPATKEQRDLLFQKMKEAGYEWDAKNKQLRKIESKQEELTEFEKSVKQVMEEAIECGDTHNLKADADMLLRLVQNPVWSEEDEEMFKSCIKVLQTSDGYDTINAKWLTSIKDRVQSQPNQEWNEDDEHILLRTINDLKFLKDTISIDPNYAVNIIDIEREIKWLESLKDRVQQPKQEWSEEDEKAINDIMWIIEAYRKNGFNETHIQIADSSESWLKSIKERVQPQYLTIIDEELIKARNEAYNDALDKIEYHSDTPTFNDGWSAAIWYLKKRNALPQTTWKPSDDQMKALDVMTITGGIPYYAGQKLELINLYNDLKKLRGE